MAAVTAAKAMTTPAGAEPAVSSQYRQRLVAAPVGGCVIASSLVELSDESLVEPLATAGCGAGGTGPMLSVLSTAPTGVVVRGGAIGGAPRNRGLEGRVGDAGMLPGGGVTRGGASE